MKNKVVSINAPISEFAGLNSLRMGYSMLEYRSIEKKGHASNKIIAVLSYEFVILSI